MAIEWHTSKALSVLENLYKGHQTIFAQMMNEELKDQVLAFKAAKFFWPQRAVDLGLTSRLSSSFPTFNTTAMESLRGIATEPHTCSGCIPWH